MKEKWLADLEIIFSQAMEAGNLQVALRAKELIAKFLDLFPRRTSTRKPLHQWSREEIDQAIAELEEIGD